MQFSIVRFVAFSVEFFGLRFNIVYKMNDSKDYFLYLTVQRLVTWPRAMKITVMMETIHAKQPVYTYFRCSRSGISMVLSQVPISWWFMTLWWFRVRTSPQLICLGNQQHRNWIWIRKLLNRWQIKSATDVSV